MSVYCLITFYNNCPLVTGFAKGANKYFFVHIHFSLQKKLILTLLFFVKNKQLNNRHSDFQLNKQSSTSTECCGNSGQPEASIPVRKDQIE